MKKIGFGTRPSEVKSRNKSIDFGDSSDNEASGSHDQRIYTPRRQPRKSRSAGSFGKILLLAIASMIVGILLGSFLLFDFSFTVAVDSMQFITGGREIEVKNGAPLSIKFSDGLKFKSVTYKGFYRFLPPKDVKVEIAGIPETTNRFLDDLVPLLKPEEQLGYTVILDQAGVAIGKIELTLDMNAKDWIIRADSLEDKGKQLTCYKKAVALDPDSEDAHTALGQLYADDKKDKSAIAEYEAVLRLKPDAVPIMRALISLYKKTGMTDKTIEMYKKLAKADPGRADDYSSRAGAIAEKQGSGDQAVAIYEKMLETNPGNIDARQKIIKLYEKKKKWNEVIKHTQALIKLDPKNADLRLYLSDIYYKKNDLNESLAAVEEAQKLRPGDPAIYLQLAVLSEKAKKYDRAIKYYRKAVQSKTNRNPVIYNNLGILLEKQGDRKEAIQNYEIAAAMAPGNAAFAQNLADAYEKEKQWKKAAETYEKIAILKKKDKEPLEAAAVLWYKAGDKKKSLGAYKKLARVEPKKILWHQKLAYLYEDVENIDGAMTEYKTILTLDPANTEAKQKRVELAKRKIKNKNK